MIIWLLILQICINNAQEFTNEIVSDSKIDTIYCDVNNNVTLPCFGIKENVSELRWICIGCHSSQFETKMAEFKNEISTTLFSRTYLNTSSFSLVLSPAAEIDSGEYRCLVNGKETTDVILRLLVQDVPDAPGRPLIMGFTSRSVNLSWTPPLNSHNSPISHYFIHIRVGEDGIWNTNLIMKTYNNSTLYTVNNLQPFTTYSFRVTAVNEMGSSSVSKESYYMLTLREVPTGKPTITAAHNISSTSIIIKWKAPQSSTIHGEFLGYRLSYKYREISDDNSTKENFVKEIFLKDTTLVKYVITKLNIYTQYLISLQVYNPDGLGPSSVVVVMTDEGVPSLPANVTLSEVTNSSIRVSWNHPIYPNGVIQGYRLYYMQHNFTDVRTVRQISKNMNYLLSGLQPFTTYKLWMKAFTWKNEGEASKPLEILTDISEPSAPFISNLTCKDEFSIHLQWDTPNIYYKAVDYYYIYYKEETQKNFSIVIVPGNETHSKSNMLLLRNLTTETLYIFKIRGVSRSIYNDSYMYEGAFSDNHRLRLRFNCDAIQAFTIVKTLSDDDRIQELSAGMIAGCAIVIFALLLGLLAIAVWRKYFNESYYYLDEVSSPPTLSTLPDWDVESNFTSSSQSTHSSSSSSGVSSHSSFKRTSISAHDFVRIVSTLHENDNFGFKEEYASINATSSDFSATTCRLDDNAVKNRYHNVVAYEHSRVTLRALPHHKKGEYLNANYIDGFQKSRAYIATQGPLPSTFSSFWRMIWEQKVKVIVMITNLFECGIRKCDKYWPDESTETYGLIQVSLIATKILSTYTIRTFKIKHTKIKVDKQRLCERILYQFHYTHWPDHGTPEYPLQVISFVKQSSKANNTTKDGPIVVHCSAGVGRTGTYIVIDAMLKQMKSKCELNIVAYLRHIRTQRNHLVQTEEQYIFVHDALAEVVASGETNINRSYLSRYINSLQSSFTTDENSLPWQLLDRQFQLATFYQPLEDEFTASALKTYNQTKNQNFDFLPIESARVSLSVRPESIGSDYINASWIPGFNDLKEFIITQHPMEQTYTDFWQLLWDHNVHEVVILSALHQPEFGIFWPTKQINLDLDTFRVILNQESDIHGYQTKEFYLISLAEDYQISVRLLFCPSWPHCLPLASATDFVKVVLNLQKPKEPIVIVDKFGGTEAAIFCAIFTLIKQLEWENHIDVYQFVKISHNHRPGLWKSQDDYLYLYRVLEAFCGVKQSNHFIHSELKK